MTIRKRMPKKLSKREISFLKMMRYDYMNRYWTYAGINNEEGD